MTREQRKDLGRKGRVNVEKNFNFEQFGNTWDKIMTDFHQKNGSWENRKNYKSWELKEY